jgi:hypothetical protein
MYTTIIHPIRKSLCLSCNEYIVLDQIYRLSHNDKYGGWCVASKAKIAEWLDLSEKTVFRAVERLIIKELISKDKQTGWIKTTDSWNEQIANSGDWAIAFNGKETQYISAKVKFANVLPSVSLSKPLGQSVLMGSVNMTDNNKSKHLKLTTTTGVVEKMLIKWFSNMEDVSNPIGLARKMLNLYSEPILNRALKNPNCTSRAELTKLADYYKKKA